MGLIDAVSKFADPYERQARLYPALLAVCPLAIAAMCVFAPQASLLSNVTLAIVACGLLYWIAGLARQRGRQLEPALFRAWGGKPSVQLMRHRNEQLDPITKARAHSFLAAALGVRFPTLEDEQRDPEQADKVYESATRWLLEQTRDTGKHGLLFAENVAYGFRRNMVGMRSIGLAAAALAIGWLAIDAGLFAAVSLPDLAARIPLMSPAHRLSLFACAAIAGLWLTGVSEGRVRTAAFAYAERLVAACDGLGALKQSIASTTATTASAGSSTDG